MQYNDFELVYMISENEEALDYMIKKYDPLFKKLSYSFAKKYKNKGVDPEDIIQHCRIILCYAIDNYDVDRDIMFYTYLLGCLKKSISKYLRDYDLKPEYCSYENFPEFKSSFDVFDNYINYEFEGDIINFKNSLDFLDSNIFELRYNGFTYIEIASLLDITKKKVDNSLLKIRKKMEKYFLFS